MKNIVVLDAHTLSPLQPGESSPFHPNWDAIAALGPLQLYPRSKPDEVVPRAQHAQILLTNKTVVSAEHIQALPELEYIGVMATGYNVVDLEAARARGIPVTNVPGYGTASVAQHVFALLLELAARVGATDAAVKNGDWVRCPDFCFTVSPFVELAGKTLGIIGYGTIGQAVARIASAFGMRILATARSPKSSDIPVEWVSLDELFHRSDVITLHCPLTEETRHLINSASLGRMKSSAFLINTGRGPLIDEEALAAALKNGFIAGFGSDVLSSEPPARTNPLLSAPRTVITPHIAWASVEARTRLMGIVARNILDFLAGSPANVVNAAAATTTTILAASEHSAPRESADEAPASEPSPDTPASVEAEDALPESPATLATAWESAETAVPDSSSLPVEEALAPATTRESQPEEPVSDGVAAESPWSQPPSHATEPAQPKEQLAADIGREDLEKVETGAAVSPSSEDGHPIKAGSEIPPLESVSGEDAPATDIPENRHSGGEKTFPAQPALAESPVLDFDSERSAGTPEAALSEPAVPGAFLPEESASAEIPRSASDVSRTDEEPLSGELSAESPPSEPVPAETPEPAEEAEATPSEPEPSETSSRWS